jgi:tetratricopeptide (TPR) repeat protein
LPEEIIQARGYYKMALQDYDAGDYLGAIKYINEAIESNKKAAESNPSDAADYRALKTSAYLALGDGKLEDMKYTEALEHYDKAVEADPESDEAYFNVGLCSQRLALYAKRRNQTDEADDFFKRSVKALERVLEISPSHTQAMVLLQEIYPKLSRVTEMADISYKILETMPADDPAAKKARSYLGSYGLPLERPKPQAPAPKINAPPAPPAEKSNPTP